MTLKPLRYSLVVNCGQLCIPFMYGGIRSTFWTRWIRSTFWTRWMDRSWMEFPLFGQAIPRKM